MRRAEIGTATSTVIKAFRKTTAASNAPWSLHAGPFLHGLRPRVLLRNGWTVLLPKLDVAEEG